MADALDDVLDDAAGDALDVDVIAFDGDDTLWHSEHLFADAHDRLAALLAGYVERAALDARLREVEVANLGLFGFGIKGFTLSLIETAIEVSDGAVGTEVIERILALGKEMLRHPVELLDGAEAAIEALSATHRLALITKGDLLHQESKIARSGLAERFERIDVVVDKDGATYRRIIDSLGVPPERFAMVGNSLRSDVLPVRALGGHAVLVPYPHVSHHEHVEDADPARDGYHQIQALDELVALVAGRP